MGLIEGIHHVSLKCCGQEEYNKTITFYTEILEIPIIRKWETGVMLGTGNGIIEIFNNGEKRFGMGTIRHFALMTKNVDTCVEKIRAAGYEIPVEPKNISIASVPPFPARIAFCKGPVGEEIEFFEEKENC